MINNLQTLYKADFSHLPETIIRDLEATEEIQQLRRDIKNKIPGSHWTNIRAILLSKLQQLLDIELKPILIESWKTHQDVEREITSQKETGSEALAIVNLEDHEIRSTHSPSLLIKIEDIQHTLRSFIGITLQLRGVSLVIQQGEISEALSGTVKGRGFMQYQNATLVDKDFLDFSISGKLITEESANSPASLSTATTTPEIVTRSADSNESEPDVSEKPPSQQSSRLSDTEKPSESISSNMIQFIIGISIALIAVFLFWQFK